MRRSTDSVKALDGTPTNEVNEQVMRLMIATTNCTVTSLAHIARLLECNNQPIAEHLDHLGQRIAGVVLDALRAWPSAEG